MINHDSLINNNPSYMNNQKINIFKNTMFICFYARDSFEAVMRLFNCLTVVI